MIYLDSSALLKLLVEEEESAALASWLSQRATVPSVSSELAKVEVIRAARRLDVQVVPAARVLLTQLDLIPLSSGLIDEASGLADPLLRSLEAIHLSSALMIREHLSAFVAYNHRLVAAAGAVELPVHCPGAEPARVADSDLDDQDGQVG